MLRKVGTQVVKWTTEGAVKEDTQNFVRAQEIVKQGGTAGNVYDPSLTEEDSVMGGFFVTFSEPMAR